MKTLKLKKDFKTREDKMVSVAKIYILKIVRKF